MGIIHLLLNDSIPLILHCVLYVPASNVCLISIPALCDDDGYVTTFSVSSCCIHDQSASLIVTGQKTGNCSLYILSCKLQFVHQAHIAQQVSSLATWHHCLGHINYTLIIHLAHKGLTSGMAVNLSMLPPKCDHCILGKQVCNKILSTWEGRRATRCLKKVFVDLTGPLS